MFVPMDRHPWIPKLLGILLLTVLGLGAGIVSASEEVDRIREKCEEMNKSIVAEQCAHLGASKDPNLLRVYKDYDYLLKASKTDQVLKDAENAESPEAKADLDRLHRYLLHERILYTVAGSIDNANSYETSATMSVGGTGLEITLRSYAVTLGSEEKRSNRRIAYLASRDLQENGNVFKLNLLRDLNEKSQELAGMNYPDFLVEAWDLDREEMSTLAEQVLETTKEEYETLLTEVTAERLDGMELKDLRQYDVPFVLRSADLDKTFPRGKEIDLAGKWLKDLGIKIKSQKKLRFLIDNKPAKSPVPSTFSIANGNDTRISVFAQGGFPDYWALFCQLGEAEFYMNIDKKMSFEDRRLGSPLLPMTYGRLFQSVLGEPGWRAKYLKMKNDEDSIARAIRFRELFDLRQAAARYLFQLQLDQDLLTPPSGYTDLMKSAMLWHQGATEEANFLLAEDSFYSGMTLVAAARAAQLREKLIGEFGEEWYANPAAGKWLKSHWAKGFQVPASDLGAALGLGELDPGHLSN